MHFYAREYYAIIFIHENIMQVSKPRICTDKTKSTTNEGGYKEYQSHTLV